MLTEKHWRSEAVLRLFLSVMVCAFLGALAMASVKMAHSGLREKMPAFIALATSAIGFAFGALFVLRKPWELDHLTRRFATLLVCIYLMLTLGSFAFGIAAKSTWDSHSWQTITNAFLDLAAILLVHFFLRGHQTNWVGGFGLGCRPGLAVLYGFLVACSFLPLGWLLQMASFKVLSLLHYSPEVQSAVQTLRSIETWSDRAVFGVMAIGFAPVAEETLFRGVLYPAIKQAGFPKIAAWAAALSFALVHLNAASFASLVLLALLLTWVYEQTQNLLASIAAHAVFNAFNFASEVYGSKLSEFFRSVWNSSGGAP